MKILSRLAAVLFLAMPALADISGPSGNYIQSRQTLQPGTTIYISSATIKTRLLLPYISTGSVVFSSTTAGGKIAGSDAFTWDDYNKVMILGGGAADPGSWMSINGVNVGTAPYHGGGNINVNDSGPLLTGGTNADTTVGILKVHNSSDTLTWDFASDHGGATLTAAPNTIGDTGFPRIKFIAQDLTTPGHSATLLISSSGVTSSTLTVTNLTSGQCVQVGAGGLLTNSGSACGSGGGGGSTISTGTLSAIPGTCAIGALFFATDQPANQQIYTCSAANTWTQSGLLGGSGALAVTSGALDINTTVLPRKTNSETISGLWSFTNPATYDFTSITLSSIAVTGSGTGLLKLTQGSAPSGASGQDILWADSDVSWLRFNPNNTTNYMLVGSSTAVTSGHAAAFSGTGSLVDGGQLMTPTATTTWTNLFKITASTLVVTQNAVFTKSSGVTSDPSPGIVDVFNNNANSGDSIFSVGSNQDFNQFTVKDQTAVRMKYGVYVGGLNIGPAGSTQKIYSDQNPSNFIEYYSLAGGSMTFATANGGGDMSFASQGTENLRLGKANGIQLTNGDARYLVRFSTDTTSFVVAISTTGHILSNSQNLFPAISSCGTLPSTSTLATDFSGTITTGSGSPTACTITFAKPFIATPDCVVSAGSSTIFAGVTSISATAFTTTFSAAFSSGKFSYVCAGHT